MLPPSEGAAGKEGGVQGVPGLRKSLLDGSHEGGGEALEGVIRSCLIDEKEGVLDRGKLKFLFSLLFETF